MNITFMMAAEKSHDQFGVGETIAFIVVAMLVAFLFWLLFRN